MPEKTPKTPPGGADLPPDEASPPVPAPVRAPKRRSSKGRKKSGESLVKVLAELLPPPQVPGFLRRPVSSAFRLPDSVKAHRSYGMFSLAFERTFELVSALVVLVLVERRYGEAGLGTFSYLLSVYTLAGILAEWGLPHLVERETALGVEHPSEQEAVLVDAAPAAFLTGLLTAAVLMVSAFFDASLTRVDEQVGAYFVIGAAVLLRTLNRLRNATLNGEGRHGEAAALQGKKRLSFLVVLVVLVLWKVPPSYLVLSFVLSELHLNMAGRRKVKLPSIRGIFKAETLARVRRTLSEGARFVFTDETLDAVLMIDLLILGLFMTSTQVGIYAEASVFARFFLLLPTSLRPVFRRKACNLAAAGDAASAASSASRAAERLFAVHAFALVALLLFYPQVLRLFFGTGGYLPLSLQVFDTFAPGLLLAGSVLVLEPLYEASGRSEALGFRSRGVLAAAVVLNAFLIPAAGLEGAAVATMFCMVLHFLLVSSGIDRAHRPNLGLYALAGGGVYLTHGMLLSLGAGFLGTILLLPVVLGGFFYVIGFFSDASSTNAAIPPNDGG